MEKHKLIIFKFLCFGFNIFFKLIIRTEFEQHVYFVCLKARFIRVHIRKNLVESRSNKEIFSKNYNSIKFISQAQTRLFFWSKTRFELKVIKF